MTIRRACNAHRTAAVALAVAPTPDLSSPPAGAGPPDLALPMVALAGWIAVALIVLLSVRRGRATGSRMDRPRAPTWAPPEWLPHVTGPVQAADSVVDDDQAHGWRVATGVHPAAVLEVPPHHRAGFAAVGGATGAAAVLDDWAGPVLDGKRRVTTRSASVYLLHGDHDQAARLARALAAEHDVALLAVPAIALRRNDTGSAVAAVVQRASAIAPCVVLFDRVDELDRAPLDVMVSGRTQRLVSDLTAALAALDPALPVVVILTAQDLEAVPRRLRDPGLLHLIAVRPPTPSQRRSIVQREARLHGVVVDDPHDRIVGLTDHMHTAAIVELIGHAIRTVQRTTPRMPPTLTARDVSAVLQVLDPMLTAPLAINDGAREVVDAFDARLGDDRSAAGLVVVAKPGNGASTVARWLAARSPRRVVWFDGRELAALATLEIDTSIAAALAQAPALIVLDGLDDVLAGTSDHGRRLRKHVLAGIDQLITTPGIAVVVAVHDAALIDLSGDCDVLHLSGPGYHERVQLLDLLLWGTVLVDIDTSELAAAMHGLTRRQIADACASARRAAALREWPAAGQQLQIYRVDFSPAQR